LESISNHQWPTTTEVQSNAFKLYYKQSTRATFTYKREHKKILLVQKIMDISNLIGSRVLVFPLAEWVQENNINLITHQFMVLCAYPSSI
jgi:hypothetical protein